MYRGKKKEKKRERATSPKVHRHDSRTSYAKSEEKKEDNQKMKRGRRKLEKKDEKIGRKRERRRREEFGVNHRR